MARLHQPAVFFLLIIAISPHSSANESGALPSVVMIVDSGSEEASSTIVQAVESQLADIDVVFSLEAVDEIAQNLNVQLDVVAKVAHRRNALVVIWCDLVGSNKVLLYLSETKGDRVLVRKIEESEQGGRAEALAVIVRSSVNAILKGGEIGVKVEPKAGVLPESLPKSKPEGDEHKVAKTGEEEDEPRPHRVETRKFWIRAAYALYMHSEKQIANHGADVGLGISLKSSWSVIVGYRILSRIEEGRSNIGTMRLARHPLCLGIAWEYDVGGLVLQPSLSLTMDFASFEMKRLFAGMEIVDDTSDILFSVLPAFKIEYWVTSRLGLFLCVAAEISLNSIHYVTVDANHEKTVLLDSWPVQPWFFAGFSVRII
jgi:hypothetical protein